MSEAIFSVTHKNLHIKNFSWLPQPDSGLSLRPACVYGVTQWCPTLCDLMDCSPPGSSAHGILQVRILEWVAMPSSRGSSQPGIEPKSLALWEDYLPSEPPRKPKNTGVGSLSLLQEIFPTQDSNWGLLHCRQILYQLSHWEVQFQAFTVSFSFV